MKKYKFDVINKNGEEYELFLMAADIESAESQIFDKGLIVKGEPQVIQDQTSIVADDNQKLLLGCGLLLALILIPTCLFGFLGSGSTSPQASQSPVKTEAIDEYPPGWVHTPDDEGRLRAHKDLQNAETWEDLNEIENKARRGYYD